jgi:hypothetical protein
MEARTMTRARGERAGAGVAAAGALAVAGAFRSRIDEVRLVRSDGDRDGER